MQNDEWLSNFHLPHQPPQCGYDKTALDSWIIAATNPSGRGLHAVNAIQISIGIVRTWKIQMKSVGPQARDFW